MRREFFFIGFLVLNCLYEIVISKRIDQDFVEENGKALKNLRVLPGVRRSVANLQEAEQAAGKAVLHLLDAKIGNKVKEAAKEVTDFLNGAVGSHAEVRANRLHSDKDKELSLLSVTAGKKLADKQKPIKKTKKGFLLNFKIPYLVTPVVAKKKNKKKKIHAHKHHHRKHHQHKHHHHKIHHKAHHHMASHNHHKVLNTRPALTHPAIQHPAVSPNHPQAAPTQRVTQPNYNAVDLSWDGYNWSARPVNSATPSSDMTPCQGACADPCNSACNLQTDCCCCPTQGTAPAVAPASPQPIQQEPPNFLQLPSANLSPSMPSPIAPQTTCVPVCKRSCLSFCPQSCCGFQRKRNKVAVSPGNSSGSGSGMELEP